MPMHFGVDILDFDATRFICQMNTSGTKCEQQQQKCMSTSWRSGGWRRRWRRRGGWRRRAALDGQNVSTYTQLRVEFDWPIPALKPACRSTSTWPIHTIIQRQNNQCVAHKRQRGFLQKRNRTGHRATSHINKLFATVVTQNKDKCCMDMNNWISVYW